MAKRQDDLTPAEDYIDQLQWRARHGWRSSVRFEPGWKYKIVYRLPRTTFLERIINALILIGLVLFAAHLFASDMLTLGEKIFFGCVFGLIVLVLFFAVRDASQEDA